MLLAPMVPVLMEMFTIGLGGVWMLMPFWMEEAARPGYIIVLFVKCVFAWRDPWHSCSQELAVCSQAALVQQTAAKQTVTVPRTGCLVCSHSAESVT